MEGVVEGVLRDSCVDGSSYDAPESRYDASASAPLELPRLFLESAIPPQSSRSIPLIPIRRSVIWAELSSWLGVEDYHIHLLLYGSQHPAQNKNPYRIVALSAIWV